MALVTSIRTRWGSSARVDRVAVCSDSGAWTRRTEGIDPRSCAGPRSMVKQAAGVHRFCARRV